MRKNKEVVNDVKSPLSFSSVKTTVNFNFRYNKNEGNINPFPE